MAHRVLIVEDNELNMKLFHDLLEASGMDILETRNGIDALRVAKEQRPDLIVSGINCGLNAGINVLYAGTVGAAIEGAAEAYAKEVRNRNFPAEEHTYAMKGNSSGT